jgi:hypothetical protein
MRENRQPTISIRGIRKASSNVFLGQIRKILEDIRDGHTSPEIIKYIRYRNSRSPDTRFSAANFWIDANPFPVIHYQSIKPSNFPSTPKP